MTPSTMVICGWAGKLMSSLGWMQSGSCPQEIRPIKKIIKSLRERCVSVWLNWPLQILPISCIRAYHDDHQPFDRQIEYLTARYGAKIYPIRCREMDVSSEEIRASVSDGHSIHGFVPDAVEEYIKDHGLYGGGVKTPVQAGKGE